MFLLKVLSKKSLTVTNKNKSVLMVLFLIYYMIEWWFLKESEGLKIRPSCTIPTNVPNRNETDTLVGTRGTWHATKAQYQEQRYSVKSNARLKEDNKNWTIT